MQRVASCLVCGSSRFEDLVWFKPDPYFDAIPGLQGSKVQYTACTACGFVFQNPTLERKELEALYALEYRRTDPPEDYTERQREIAEQLYQYLDRFAPRRAGPRRVLDIGCAAGFFLHAFHARGWEVVGLDANERWNEWGRRHLGVDLRTGFYDEHALPGERFDLILFSHVIEHLPDPFPTLKAIRGNLAEDGVLFLGAPNVLRPHCPVISKVMAGPHVCLYSPRTIVPLLSKAGFTVQFQDNWYPRGLRVIARPSSEPAARTVWPSDNWKIVHELYLGLLRPERGNHLHRNLTALVPGHFEALEELCKKGVLGGHRIVREDGRVVNVEIDTPHGLRKLFDRPEPPQGRESRAGGAEGAPPGALVIQVGMGLGTRALAMLAELESNDQRLLICEPDPAIVLAALMARDLTPLLKSPRVKLVTGTRVPISHSLRGWMQEGEPVVVTEDPIPHRFWPGRYDQIAAYFRTGQWLSKNLTAWEFKFAA